MIHSEMDILYSRSQQYFFLTQSCHYARVCQEFEKSIGN